MFIEGTDEESPSRAPPSYRFRPNGAIRDGFSPAHWRRGFVELVETDPEVGSPCALKAAGYSRSMSTMVVELYDALVSAGAPEEKARGAAQAMSEESLATKADITRLEQVTKAEIARLEQDIIRLEQTTKADIAKLEQVTKADIAKLEQSTKADIAKLEQVTKAEIAKLERASSGDIARLEQATKAESVKQEKSIRGDIAKLERDIAKVERELSVVKWMTGAIVAGVVSLVIKSFFG